MRAEPSKSKATRTRRSSRPASDKITWPNEAGRIPLLNDPGTLKSYSEVALPSYSRERVVDPCMPMTSSDEQVEGRVREKTYVDVDEEIERGPDGRGTRYLKVTEARRKQRRD